MTERRLLEARTVRTIADLRALLDAAEAAANVADVPADHIRFVKPIDLRLVEISYTPGEVALDLQAHRW